MNTIVNAAATGGKLAHEERPCGEPQGLCASSLKGENQLTRFQVWPPQNIPPKAQPWTLSELGPFSAIVES
jgi:hypothetical protein